MLIEYDAVAEEDDILDDRAPDFAAASSWLGPVERHARGDAAKRDNFFVARWRDREFL